MISFTKPTITTKDLTQVLETMIADRIDEGAMTKQFENTFAKHLGTSEALVVNSAHSALYLILQHLNFPDESEIILSAYAEIWILEIIKLFNLKPVLVDIEEGSYLSSENKIREKINEKTKIILINHLYGYPFDFKALFNGYKEKIVLIEDCTHALGSRIHGDFVGKKGHFSIFSFDINSIITSGSGAAILTQSKKDFNQLKALRSSLEHFFENGRINTKITDIQSAMGYSELVYYIDKFINKRKEIGEYYNSCMERSKNNFILPTEEKQLNYNYYPIQLNGSLKIAIELFKKYKVQVTQLIKSPFFELLRLKDSDFPNTRNIQLKTLLIPLYPSLKKKEIENIGQLIINIR